MQLLWWRGPGAPGLREGAGAPVSLAGPIAGLGALGTLLDRAGLPSALVERGLHPGARALLLESGELGEEG